MDNLLAPTCVTEESWEAFIELRRRKGQRAPLTEYAARMVIRRLMEAYQQGYDAQHMIDEAIEKGWTTVYAGPNTPKASRSAKETKEMLDSMKQTPEQRAASEEARRRVMAGIRRVT